MKRYKKTYAIFHLTEKHTVFYLGKTKVHVSFTGGIVTKKGVTPATFTTDDPIVQLAIENSEDFKKGAIKLRSKYPMQGEVRIGTNPRGTCDKPAMADDYDKAAMAGTFDKPAMAGAFEKAGEKTKQSAESDAEESEAATQEESGADEVRLRQEEAEEVRLKQEGADEVLLRQEEAENGQPEQEGAEDGDAQEVVDASCKDVAKQYLQEHFGESPSPLRTREDVQRCAAKYGIRFNFI